MTDANPTEAIGESPTVASVEPLPIDRANAVVEDVIDNVETVIVGQRNAIEHVVGAMLAGGHVLLEDVPGVGKTMLARSIARSIDCEFRRVQFTPDLLPSDITGVNVFNQKTREFEFRPGPVFGNVVLGDEINRAPPKAQSALLEAMEEGQVTVDGTTRPVPSPFTVIATQNAIESEQAYPLPFAQVDRFTKRLSLGYPDEDDEVRMADRVLGTHPIESVGPVTDLETARRLRKTVAEVTVEEPVERYATRLAAYTRERAMLGVSPRGTLQLLGAAQARALMEGRDYVLPDDVKTEASVTLAHRVQLEGEERGGEELIDQALTAVAVE